MARVCPRGAVTPDRKDPDCAFAIARLTLPDPTLVAAILAEPAQPSLADLVRLAPQTARAPATLPAPTPDPPLFVAQPAQEEAP